MVKELNWKERLEGKSFNVILVSQMWDPAQKKPPHRESFGSHLEQFVRVNKSRGMNQFAKKKLGSIFHWDAALKSLKGSSLYLSLHTSKLPREA